MKIRRLWHGWTSAENAELYQNLLHDEVIPGIEAKNIPGLQSFEVLRKDHDNEVEFVTIITFNSIQNVMDFQGDDYEVAYVPESAKKLLKNWDDRCAHYELVEIRNYNP